MLSVWLTSQRYEAKAKSQRQVRMDLAQAAKKSRMGSLVKQILNGGEDVHPEGAGDAVFHQTD